MFSPLMTAKDLKEAFYFIYDNIELFAQDSKFPKQLFTEMYIENGTAYFEQLRSKGLIEQIGISKRIKPIYRAKYIDDNVVRTKNELKELKRTYKEGNTTGLLQEYKYIIDRNTP